MTFDLYAWKSPRDLDADAAEALIASWEANGGDPGRAPFELSADVGWFYRELMQDVPGLEVSSDAVSSPSTTPIWLATAPESPARVVALRLSPTRPDDVVESIFGLAAKYDLVLYDPQSRGVHVPIEVMAANASATFWPRGAIQAAVAGGIGAVIALVAWLLAIPLVSGLLIVGGGFMVAMSGYTFIHEGRKAIRRRRADVK